MLQNLCYINLLSVVYFIQRLVLNNTAICLFTISHNILRIKIWFYYPQITKKTFAPAMLPPVNDEPESRFESFTKTVERVSSWLDSTG